MEEGWHALAPTVAGKLCAPLEFAMLMATTFKLEDWWQFSLGWMEWGEEETRRSSGEGGGGKGWGWARVPELKNKQQAEKL